MGHIVVCGRSAGEAADHVRGGIFDYWGCPASSADRVLAEVRALIERCRRPARPHVGSRGGCLLREAIVGERGLPVIAESERAVGVLAELGARSRGHSVFFPRRHAPNLHDLEDAEIAEIFGLIKRVARALALADYNVIQNNGALAARRCSMRTSTWCRSRGRRARCAGQPDPGG